MTGGAGFLRDMQSNYERNRSLLKKRKSMKDNHFIKSGKKPLVSNYDELKKWRLAEQRKRKQVRLVTITIWLLGGIVALALIYIFTV